MIEMIETKKAKLNLINKMFATSQLLRKTAEDSLQPMGRLKRALGSNPPFFENSDSPLLHEMHLRGEQVNRISIVFYASGGRSWYKTCLKLFVHWNVTVLTIDNSRQGTEDKIQISTVDLSIRSFRPS